MIFAEMHHLPLHEVPWQFDEDTISYSIFQKAGGADYL